MRVRWIAGMVCAAVSVAAMGQGAGQSQGAGDAKSFEVASVRKSAPMDMRTLVGFLQQGRRPDSTRVDGSRATYTYTSVKQLIAYAYRLRVYEVDGPDWMATDRMDIAAKLPDGAASDDAPEMMRALLQERFRLAAHKEKKDAPVLALAVAKSGPKLTESKAEVEELDRNAPLEAGQTRMDTADGPILLTKTPDGATMYHMGARGKFTLKFDGETRTLRLTGEGMSMRGLAQMMTTLGGGDGREVVDATGLSGRYDVEVEFPQMALMQSLRAQGIEIPQAPGAGPGTSASDPGGDGTLSDALSKLGLRLEKSHAVVDRLVVDHVEQDPTEQ